MKMRHILLTVLISSFGISANAQSFTITLEPGTIFSESGTTVDHGNQGSLGINIFYAETSSSFASLTGLFDDPLAPDATAISSLGGLTWSAMSQTTSDSFEFWTTPGWTGGSGTAIDGTEDNNVLVAIIDVASVGDVVSGTNVGLLLSDSPISGFGQTNYSLGSVTNMTVLAGVAGSIQMVSAVPEPSAFALLAGCFGLAAVMVRRRR